MGELAKIDSRRGKGPISPGGGAPLPPRRRGVPSGAEDEDALIEGMRRGDPSSYERVVSRYGGVMLAVARRFLPSEADAQDAVQDAFLSAFRSLEGFREDARLSTWLHRIVVNAALMKLRAARRRPESALEDLLPRFDETGHAIEPSRAWPPCAEERLLREETRALVRRCIDQLPGSYRVVLLLRDVEEMDTEETARALDLTPAAVKVRLHRARQALRTLLERALRQDAGEGATVTLPHSVLPA